MEKRAIAAVPRVGLRAGFDMVIIFGDYVCSPCSLEPLADRSAALEGLIPIKSFMNVVKGLNANQM